MNHPRQLLSTGHLILLIAVLLASCVNKQKEQAAEGKKANEELIKTQLIERCKNINGGPQGNPQPDFDEQFSLKATSYRIYGGYNCRSSFAVTLPEDPEDPGKELNQLNYDFFELVLVDTNSTRVIETRLNRADLLKGQDTALVKYQTVLSFMPDDYDEEKKIFYFNYTIMNIADFSEKFMKLAMNFDATYTIEETK